MKLLLITPDHPPVRLIRQGTNLRAAIGAAEMFKETVATIDMAAIDSARVIAPYNRTFKILPIMLLTFALGTLITILPYPRFSIGLFAAIPLALAVVAWIVPSIGSSTWVIVTVHERSRHHMIAVRREEMDDLRRMLPEGIWLDDMPAMDQEALNDGENMRLKLMQVGMALLTVSFSAFGITALQNRHLGLGVSGMPEGTGEAITIMFIVVEIGAFILFIACWLRMVRLLRRR